jgi:hypothetical protein
MRFTPKIAFASFDSPRCHRLICVQTRGNCKRGKYAAKDGTTACDELSTVHGLWLSITARVRACKVKFISPHMKGATRDDD